MQGGLPGSELGAPGQVAVSTASGAESVAGMDAHASSTAGLRRKWSNLRLRWGPLTFHLFPWSPQLTGQASGPDPCSSLLQSLPDHPFSSQKSKSTCQVSSGQVLIPAPV